MNIKLFISIATFVLAQALRNNERNPSASTQSRTRKSFNIVIYEQANFSGTKQWAHGSYRECRALNGYPVGSVRFVSEPGGEEPIPDATAQGSRLVFYSDYGCNGDIIKSTIGNVPQICHRGTACNLAKSVMFLPTIPPRYPRN